jgi:hypothetical protein
VGGKYEKKKRKRGKIQAKKEEREKRKKGERIRENKK